MPKITNDRRITALGKQRMEQLLTSSLVDDYHKILIRGIKSNLPKNLSKSDCDVFEMLNKQYEGVV